MFVYSINILVSSADRIITYIFDIRTYLGRVSSPLQRIQRIFCSYMYIPLLQFNLSLHGRQRQHGMRSLPDTSTPDVLALSNAIFTPPSAPKKEFVIAQLIPYLSKSHSERIRHCLQSP